MLSMRTIDNGTIRIENEQKQNELNNNEVAAAPTPRDVQENLAKQGMKEPVLGELYDGPVEQVLPQSAEVRNWEEKMALDETEHDGQSSLSPVETDEDTYESTLDGLNIVETDDADSDVDELPEDLKDVLGDPDDDVKA